MKMKISTVITIEDVQYISEGINKTLNNRRSIIPTALYQILKIIYNNVLQTGCCLIRPNFSEPHSAGLDKFYCTYFHKIWKNTSSMVKISSMFDINVTYSIFANDFNISVSQNKKIADKNVISNNCNASYVNSYH